MPVVGSFVARLSAPVLSGWIQICSCRLVGHSIKYVRPEKQLPVLLITAVLASDHLRAFNMCLDSDVCMITLRPYASNTLLLMDYVCVCVCILCVCAHMCSSSPWWSNTLRIIHNMSQTVYVREGFCSMHYNGGLQWSGIWAEIIPTDGDFRGSCAVISSECPAPSAATRNDPSYRPSHIKHPSPSLPLIDICRCSETSFFTISWFVLQCWTSLLIFEVGDVVVVEQIKSYYRIKLSRYRPEQAHGDPVG